MTATGCDVSPAGAATDASPSVATSVVRACEERVPTDDAGVSIFRVVWADDTSRMSAGPEADATSAGDKASSGGATPAGDRTHTPAAATAPRPRTKPKMTAKRRTLRPDGDTPMVPPLVWPPLVCILLHR